MAGHNALQTISRLWVAAHSVCTSPAFVDFSQLFYDSLGLMDARQGPSSFTDSWPLFADVVTILKRITRPADMDWWWGFYAASTGSDLTPPKSGQTSYLNICLTSVGVSLACVIVQHARRNG